MTAEPIYMKGPNRTLVIQPIKEKKGLDTYYDNIIIITEQNTPLQLITNVFIL